RDINMPVIDGFEFLNQLQKIEGIDFKKLYVIMLTSSTDPKDIEEAAKYSEIVKGYIKKPLMKEHLTKILEYF
ncbi:MAG: response regulator, partial [Chitinophagaceae bacterium]